MKQNSEKTLPGLAEIGLRLEDLLLDLKARGLQHGPLLT